MYNQHPKGYFERLLVMDCETSGISFNTVDPSFDDNLNKPYQVVSWGLVVADTDTLKPIDSLYLEIKYDGESLWNDKAEQVHGLSKAHLAQHGMDEQEAVENILSFVSHYFGPIGEMLVPCAGHNVSTFDIFFMRRLLNKHNLMFKTGNRFTDTNTIGFTCYRTFNSDDLFDLMGITRDNHNALEDAIASLKVLNYTRKLCDRFIG